MKNLIHNSTPQVAWATVNSGVKKLKATIHNTNGEYVIGDWSKIKLMYAMDTNHGNVYFWMVEDATLTCKGDKLSGCSLIDVDSHILVVTHELMSSDNFYSTMCHENFHFNHWHYNSYEDLTVESGARIAEAAYRMTESVRRNSHDSMNPCTIDNFEATSFNGWLYDEMMEFKDAEESSMHDEALDILGLLVLGADVDMIPQYLHHEDRATLSRTLLSLRDCHFDYWQSKQHRRGRSHIDNAALRAMVTLLIDNNKANDHDL